MGKVDWIIHLVTNDACEECSTVENGFIDYACNAHTHGMSRFGHKDFQIVLNIPTYHIEVILNTLGCRVRDGEVFHEGDLVYGIYEDCQLKLAEYEEDGRMVLRVLIPDENSVFPDDDRCDPSIRLQMMPTDALYIDGELFS